MGKTFKGYTGKELRVFLGKKQTEVRESNQRIMRAYLGGVGYGAKVFYDELSPGIDSLSPENKLIFTTSPLSLHKVPGGGVLFSVLSLRRQTDGENHEAAEISDRT